MLASAMTQRDNRNLLLSLLPDAEYRALAPHLELMPTPMRFVVFERDKPIEHVYFPCSGAHSVLAIMEDGMAVEVGTVGREGLSTVDLLTGSDIATETTICQIPGESLRMPATVFREAISRDTMLRRVSMRFLQAYLAQVSQSVACNRLHPLEERFARWVLASGDRVDSDRFPITQEFLADMLGVHRPSVTLVAKTFQRAGFIEYTRGVMTILDRSGMEESACECYGVIKRQFQRIIGKPVG